MGNFEARKLTDHIYWVGAIDWNLRDFHGYTTNRGTTYNAFLILDEKVVLVDTVKEHFMDEMMERIATVIPPEKIDIIISNHAEMDHSGCLRQVMELVNPERVLASVNGVRDLNEHFQFNREIQSVQDGETLNIGAGTLTFLHSPMLHWPDSMVTWYDADKTVFPQDAFGMHLASEERFYNEIDPEALIYEARKYYANILLPFSTPVSRFVDKFLALNLPVEMIAPDHGPLWTGDGMAQIINLYKELSAQKRNDKVVIVYDTMWGSTAKMAHAVAEGVAAQGSPVEVIHMAESNRSDVATALLDAGGFVLGSPTLNSMIFPTIADVTSYLTGLKPQGLVGAAFGSYGWSGQSLQHLNKILEGMKVKMVHPGYNVKYVPTADDLIKCRELGATVAEAAKAKA